VRTTGLNMIQWRNFNIDPDWYLGKTGVMETGEPMGIRNVMEQLKEEFPSLQFGYFNPPMERIAGDFEKDFAH
jgi:hypothetical protein